MARSQRKSAKRAPTKARAKAPSLLVELLTEELPPKSLHRLSASFTQGVFDGLKTLGFLSDDSKSESFATPRRLAVRVTAVSDRQPNRSVERRGPAVAAALDPGGQPTPALLGFARSCGVAVTKLERQVGEKGEHFVFRTRQKGEALTRHLPALVEASVKKLPVAKLMRWGSGEAQFVRPVHGLVLLHGAKVIPGQVLGAKSGNKTRGHRFLSKGTIMIPHAEKYEDVLRRAGKVIASFEERCDAIRRAAMNAAAKREAHVFPPKNWDEARFGGDGAFVQRRATARAILSANQELLDEVTAIVEWPAVYTGGFDPAFLDVPAEALSLSMQKNQKYFALIDPAAKLLPAYLVVSNIETRNPGQIVHGNERVLRARLADARFFFEQDRKVRLETRVPRLAQVIYLKKLGTQLERVERLRKIAVAVAGALALPEATRALVDRAAYLCKADLLTEMVGEFPELQGIMGGHYALHDGEPREIGEAIEAHYRPRHAGDLLPADPVSLCVALADKLEAMVGIYGIGMIPTGDKDPYALRRQALGVARIVIERNLALDLHQLISFAQAQFAPGLIGESTGAALYDFILDRLRPYLRERGFKPDEIEAVLSLKPGRLDQAVRRLEALQSFRRLPEADALAAANKRIRNILRQAGATSSMALNPQLLREQAERTLAGEVAARRVEIEPMYAAGDYTAALKRLASLRDAVDLFFDQVMVMADDEALKRNRLALLDELSRLFLGAADISRLQS